MTTTPPWLLPASVHVETAQAIRDYIDRNPAATYDSNVALVPLVVFPDRDDDDWPPAPQKRDMTPAEAIGKATERMERDNPVSMRVYRQRARVDAFQEVADTLGDDYPEARALVNVMRRLATAGLSASLNGHE